MTTSKTLANNKPLRIFTLCCLYLAQGIPNGFMAQVMTSEMTAEGMTEGDLGLFGLAVGLPWLLKIILGPIIDLYTTSSYGKRRPWLIGAQILMVFTLIGMSFLTSFEAQFHLICLAAFIYNIWAVFQDTALDALIVDLTPKTERAAMNSWVSVLRLIGFTGIGVWGGGELLRLYGLHTTFFIQAMIVFLLIVPIILYKEHETLNTLKQIPTNINPSQWKDGLTSLYKQNTNQTFIFCLAIGIIPSIQGLFLQSAVINYGAQTSEDYQQLIYYSQTIGIIGMVLGGYFSKRFCSKLTIMVSYAFSALLGGCIFGLYDNLWSNSHFVLVIMCLVTISDKVCWIALLTRLMDLTNPKYAGTHFGILSSLLMVGPVIGYVLAWQDLFDSQTSTAAAQVFVITGIVQALLVFLVPHMNPKNEIEVTQA